MADEGTNETPDDSPSLSDELAQVQEPSNGGVSPPGDTPPPSSTRTWTPARIAALVVGVVAVIAIIAVLVSRRNDDDNTPAASTSDSAAASDPKQSGDPAGSGGTDSSDTTTTAPTTTTVPTTKTVSSTGVSFLLPTDYLVVDLTAENFQDQLDQIGTDNPSLASGAAQAAALLDQGGKLWATDPVTATATQNVVNLAVSPTPIDIADPGARDELMQQADSLGAVDIENHDVTTPVGPGLAVGYKITTQQFDAISDVFYRVLYVPQGDQVFVVTLTNGDQAQADQLFQQIVSSFKAA